MARQRRQPIETQTAEQKPKVAYRDTFQQNVGKQVEEIGKGLQGKGKFFLYGLAAVAVIAIIGFVIYSYSRRQNDAAQAAFGKAIETTQAQVTASPMPGMPGKTYATEKEKSDAVIAAMTGVAANYGSPFSDRAKYMAAMERLKLDRAAGIAELETASKSSDKDTSAMATFALAQAKAGDNKLDEAATLYNQLIAGTSLIPAKETLNFNLAAVYEKQGKNTEAAQIYFDIVKQGREAKTGAGKPLPMSATAREAQTKLEKIAPDKAKELPPEPSVMEEQ
jgi:tetratricopeptide (TPR) repeat protein